jgi:hypothetical protein
MLKSCGKRARIILLQAAGNIARAERLLCPCLNLTKRARPVWIRPFERGRFSQRGIVADWSEGGKEKMRLHPKQHSHSVHSFSTRPF